MHKSLPPHGNRKHDLPARRGNRFLRINSQFDLVELALDPVVVATIVVQLAKHLQRFVCAVDLYQVTGRFWEEQHTAYDDQAG